MKLLWGKTKGTGQSFKQTAINFLGHPGIALGVRIGAVLFSFVLAVWAVYVLIDVNSHPPRDPNNAEHQKTLRTLYLAMFLAFGTGTLFAVLLALQSFSRVFVAPTGDQIWGDLVASIWGLPFSVPLVFFALDGASGASTWVYAVMLIFAGVAFPAIRPRLVHPGPSGPGAHATPPAAPTQPLPPAATE